MGVVVVGNRVLRIPANNPRAVQRSRTSSHQGSERFVEQSVLHTARGAGKQGHAWGDLWLSALTDLLPGPLPFPTHLPPSSEILMVPKSAGQLTHQD